MVVERRAGMLLPEARLAEHRCEDRFGTIECEVETIQKPRRPCGDVEIALLRGLSS
jgi:hypothetical protein